jgi:hypothetical protein
MTNKVLIIGSKPNSQIPNVKVSKIYSSNSAAEKVKLYESHFGSIDHTCIIGVDHFLGNADVKKKVVNSKIDNLVVRGTRSISQENFKYNPLISYLNGIDQFKIQSKIINNFYFNLFFAEFNYESNLVNSLIHVLKCIKKRKFLGASTGFFSIMYAHLENPHSELIVSGIGMQEDKILYDKKSFGFIKRARVDKYLIKKVNNKFKKKIITTDDDFSKNTNVSLWNKTFI